MTFIDKSEAGVSGTGDERFKAQLPCTTFTFLSRFN